MSVPTSVITQEKMLEYLDESRALLEAFIDLCNETTPKPFVVALAAATLLRGMNITLEGDIEWWCNFLRTANYTEFIAKFGVRQPKGTTLTKGGQA